MDQIFTDAQGRLRSAWRAALFLLVYVVVGYAFIIAAFAVAGIPPETPTPAPLLVVIFSISTALALALGWLFGRLFEKMPFAALGCSFSGPWLRNLALGLAVGSAAFIGALFVALLGRGLTFTVNTASSGSAIAWTLLSTLIILVVAAASEETLFRGYLLQTFVRSGAVWIGVVVTSVLFSLAHNKNPSADPLALANTLLAGVWFAAAYLKTRDLWFPFGVHLAWNWLQGPVFGINVSGIAEFSPDPVLRAIDSGPAWLTGGSYGIEGGVACTISLLISLGLIYFLPIKAEPPA